MVVLRLNIEDTGFVENMNPEDINDNLNQTVWNGAS